jgi:tetratricopeptide (TPR) repeat protein
LDTARKQAEKGYAMQMEISVTYAITAHQLLLGSIHLDLGNIGAAQNYAEEALELSIKGKTLYGEGRLRILLGRILGIRKLANTDEAIKYILQGIRILEELKLRPFFTEGYSGLAALYADKGDYGKALEWLKKAEDEFQDMGIDLGLSFCKSRIGWTLSKLNPSQLNHSEQIIFDALKIAEDIESKPALAYGHGCLGGIYADSGQKEKALENIKKAESMYQEMGMVLWLGKTREVLDRI